MQGSNFLVSRAPHCIAELQLGMISNSIIVEVKESSFIKETLKTLFRDFLSKAHHFAEEICRDMKPSEMAQQIIISNQANKMPSLILNVGQFQSPMTTSYS